MNLLNVQKNKKCGFTLAELLIVVAIVGILVAISIPIFSVQLHKARVAADWANLRAYYSEIQADYIATGKYNPEVPASDNTSYHYLTEITFLDGQRVELKAGKILIGKSKGENGYEIVYYCNEYLRTHNVEPHYYKCSLSLGASVLAY